MLSSYNLKKLFKISLFFIITLSWFVVVSQNEVNVSNIDDSPTILETNSVTDTKPEDLDNNPELITTYSVEKGDTLYAISNRYGVSIPHIKIINNLSSNILSIGQVLKIGYATSAKVKTNNIWTVSKGDTLYAISKKTGVAVSTITTLNNIQGNLIIVGKTLILK